MTIISVRGEAFVEVAPERATVSIVIAVDGPEKSAVQQRASDARNQCISTIRPMSDAKAGPVTEWTASQLQVWSERPWNADGAQLPPVFHSRSTLDVTFSDLDAVGAWTDTAAAMDGVTIAGIDWKITDLTRQELEGRCSRDAVANAAAKASVYASALGLGDVRPIEISEPAASQPEYGAVSRMVMASAGDPTEFAPKHIRIAVQVNARFEARSAD
ncbi:hypothetical protein GCM10011313_05210 [Mycetocola zhadangensis]|nr:hypothetical protein GCM10011313_05210 [Mycetocola zhadangensis]